MATIEDKCSICMDSFKNPKKISCNHSFCYKCLEDYVRCNLRNGKFDCPLCRTSVELPKSDLSDFFQTISGNSDIDSVENFACDLCDPKRVACGRCLDCEENLCQFCCHAHEKSKATKLHKICDLGTLDPEMKGKIRQRILCEKHNEEEIKLFCQKCNVVMCVLCKAVNHDTHPTKTVSDAAAEVQTKLEATIHRCTEKLRLLDACSEMGKEVEKKINDTELEEIKAVEKQHSQLLILLDQEFGKIKDKIKSVYKELRKENAVFKADVQTDTRTCSKANEDVKKLINQGTHIEKIQKGPDLERLIANATRKGEHKPPRLYTKIFSPNIIKTSQLIPLLGVVKNSTKVITVDTINNSVGKFSYSSLVVYLVKARSSKRSQEVEDTTDFLKQAIHYQVVSVSTIGETTKTNHMCDKNCRLLQQVREHQVTHRIIESQVDY